MTAPRTGERRRVYVRRRLSDGRWSVAFRRGGVDVYDSWAEAVRAATALSRAEHPLPRLSLADRRAHIPDEYQHFRSYGMSHRAACDRLARIYGVKTSTIADYVAARRPNAAA